MSKLKSDKIIISKKITAQKPVKAPNSKKEKSVITQARLKFVSFSFGATIPTQSFGNIQPHITVEAPTYEEARDFAIPKIEELYAKYAEVKPTFLGKITVTEKEVSAPVPKEEAPKTPSSGSSPEASAPSTSAAPAQSQTVVTPESVLKAEKAIALAATYEAVIMIQDQIEKSIKIPAEFKPNLITLVLKRRNALK